MKMNFKERPYSGKSFRPTPEIHLDANAHLLIVATPWGPRASARKVIERMADYLATAREDREATSPFDRLSCLSSQANNLRISLLLANEALYREDNQQEYRAGVEVFAALIDEGELVWIQVGNPQLILCRKGRGLLPLASQIDLSFDLSEKQLLPPMPAQLLGLDSSVNPSLNSFRARSGDKLILLSHSHLPETLFSMMENDRDPESLVELLSQRLAKAHPHLAFWLGVLELDGNLQEPSLYGNINDDGDDGNDDAFKEIL